MEYLKISGFQNSTIIAEIESFEPFQAYTIYGHSHQNPLFFEPIINLETN
jgi:hypothetical protein